jgi:pentatricopeptide repeat protein
MLQQAVAATPSELSAGPRVRDYLAAQPEPADVATGNALLHVLAHKALVDEARTVYEHMKTTGVACDAQTYASLIHGAGRAGRPELAQEYHDEMVARGVQGSVAVYGALATAWRDVSLDKAAGVLDVMRKHGVRPNEVVYTAVLKACTIHRNYDRAWEVFGDMRYWNVAPDEVTYSTMITACAKAREAERALLLFDEMREKGLAVGIEVYGAVMHALSLRFDMHVRVFELLHSMKGAAVNPDERIVASLLHSCGTVGNVKAAHAVWNNMTRADSRLYICDPSLRMHNSLLKTYANAIRSRGVWMPR